VPLAAANGRYPAVDGSIIAATSLPGVGLHDEEIGSNRKIG
jgi:hypothetical protein